MQRFNWIQMYQDKMSHEYFFLLLIQLTAASSIQLVQYKILVQYRHSKVKPAKRMECVLLLVSYATTVHP